MEEYRNNQINNRLKFFICITLIFFSILLLRLFYVQVINNKYYKEILKEKTDVLIYGSTAPRGRIYDRNGKLIVDNEPNKVIFYKKCGLSTKEEIELSYKLGEVLDMDIKKVDKNMLVNFYLKKYMENINNRLTEYEIDNYKRRKITASELDILKKSKITDEEIDGMSDIDKKAAYIYYIMNKGYSKDEKIIKDENVSEEEYATIASLKLKGVDVKLSWRREYLYDDTFRSIIGTIGNIEQENKDYYLNKGYTLSDIVGTSYLEYMYDDYLKGEKNVYKYIDSDLVLVKEGKRGNDLYLTIDIELQKKIENIIIDELYKAKDEPNTRFYNRSFVVVSDPNTGEVLAMAGKQIVNTNGTYRILDYTPGVFSTSATVGSVVKGASHIVGYNTGALKIGEVRNDICVKLAGANLKCSWKQLGTVNDITALAQSSNTYQFYTAMKVAGYNYVYNGAFKINTDAFNIYRNTFKEFGLGVKTEIDLPNESTGFRGTDDKNGLLLDFSIGQYDTYTALQLNQYVSTIANGGNRMKLQLLKSVKSSTTGENIFEYNPIILNKINTKQEYLDRVKTGFRAVTTYGTGYGYVNDSYNAAGKTGTSQSFVDSDNDGKIDHETISYTFVGYAPYDNPRVAFSVISPDVYDVNSISEYKSRVNKRIVRRITDAYFELNH